MKSINIWTTILVIFIYSLFIHQTVNAANFNQDLKDIRSEINRDNLQEAIKKIKKIEINNETEQEIIGEIKHFKGDKTIIVIAHRLSTLAHCDRIYCMEQGHISKVGKPEEILEIT